MDELYYWPATQIANAILERKVSAVEVLDIHLKRISEHNPKVNAIILLDEKQARKKAKEADEALAKGEIWGPLHGLPFTAKDTYVTNGLRTCFGNPLYKNHIPNCDATLVAKLKQAGAILLGKTNAPDFSFDWQTNSSLFGRTSNPYNLDYIVGGSSGGSAAALATGFTSICLGSDIAGSLRVPAHCCGVCTIRPTEQALSDFGHYMLPDQPKIGRNMVTCGPLTRNIEDLKLAVSILWGQDDNNWTIAPVNLKNQPPVTSLKGLKIAYSSTLGNVTVCQDTKKALEKLLVQLTQAGCSVKEAYPKDLEANYAQEVWGIICGVADMQSSLPNFVPKLLPKLWLRSKFSQARFAKSLIKGINSSYRDLMFALEARDKLIKTSTEFFREYDIWITPVGATTAFKHCKTGSKIPIDNTFIPYSEVFAPFNCPTTLLANPIVTMPIGFSTSNLPIGIQLHGKRWNDWKTLEIAKLLETLIGGFQPPKL